MGVGLLEPKTTNAADLIHPRRISRDEYFRLDESGAFEEERVERIDGIILDMHAIGSLHAAAVDNGDEILSEAFGRGFTVRSQSPLSLGADHDPQPDLAVVKGRPYDYARAQPTSALLILEVSDSSVLYDQTVKASLYAKHGIADYWILNLVDRQLEVYRDPIARDPGQFGFAYSTVRIYRAGQSVAPLSHPDKPVAVSDLLPANV